jgi:hypothetical protein
MRWDIPRSGTAVACIGAACTIEEVFTGAASTMAVCIGTGYIGTGYIVMDIVMDIVAELRRP